MTRPLIRRFGLLLCLAMMACETDPSVSVDEPHEAAQLHFLIADQRLELLQALPSPWVDLDVQNASIETQAKDADLHWEMRSSSGAMLASGDVADPRALRVEGGMMGPTGPLVQLGGSGTVRVLVPDVPGMIQFFDVSGGVLAEHAYQPIRGSEIQGADLNAGKTDFDRDSDVIGSPELVHGSDESTGRFNVLIVPDGFVMDELPAFRDAVSALVERFVTIEPYRSNAETINVWRQDIRSQESGIAAFGEERDTAFRVEFGNGVDRIERCIVPSATWSSTTAANLTWLRERTTADVVVIIANSPNVGGCAQPNNQLLVQTLHAGAADQARTLAHELGHALFGLGDEYEEPGFACGGGILTGLGRNITRDLNSIPWLSRVDASTPIPTPLSSEADVVGAFAGAGGCEGDVWRPMQQCAMRVLTDPFCDVCASIIEAAFRRRQLDLREIEVVNRAGFGIIAGCSPLSAPDCSPLTDIADGESAVLKIRDGQFILYGLADGLRWNSSVFPESRRVVIYDNPSNPLVELVEAMGDAGVDASYDAGSDAGPGSTGPETYANNTSLDIPDDEPAGVRSDIAVELEGAVTSVRVSVDIAHTYRGDLEVFVEKDGRRVMLSAREGGGSDDLVRMFDVDGFSDQNAVGTWTLGVSDHAAADTGTLRGWSIELTTEAGSTLRTSTFERDSLIIIPDAQPFVIGRDTIEVPESGVVAGIRLRVDLTHESYSDLRLSLTHGGVSVDLAIDRESGDFVRTYALTDFDGQDMSGTWTLSIEDTVMGGEGTVNSWALDIMRL